ncbi:MAG: GNAT family N-acetyltransferase [Bryobacteraceae bacterium]|jgi:ribosomal-protein-alanine N-acetyltransferase
MSSEFTIRRFRLSDMVRILEIERAIFPRDAYDRNLFAEYFHTCGELFLVLVRRGNICGYMLTCIRPRPEIVSLAVQPGERRKGAARLLLESTIRRLRRRQVGRLNLMVRVKNRAARKFYVKHGFVKIRVVRQYYEDGTDGFLMSRNL